MPRLITVFGATGVQGGSVISAVLANPTLSKEYTIRAVTRDPAKPSSQALAKRGVETVQADLDDNESIKKAVQGSHTVFAVTNYWEKQSKDSETAQGRMIADSCRDAEVKHLIWSALPHVSRMTGGVLTKVEHFDSKAEVAEYIEDTKDIMVATYFMPGFYMQNIKGMIRLDQDGVPTLMQPWVGDKTRVALLDAAKDTGTYVAGIMLQDLGSVNGLSVQACSDWLTPNEMIETLNKVAGTTVKFQQVSEDDFMKFVPPAAAAEMTENMVLVRDYDYFGPGTEEQQAKHDKILGDMRKTSWEQFVRNNGPWTWSQGGKGLYDHL